MKQERHPDMCTTTRTLIAAVLLSLVAHLAIAQENQNPAGVEQAVVDRYEAKAITVSSPDGAHTLQYRILPPANVEPGKKYPLVIFLHGSGERGEDNIAQLKYFPSWISEPEMRQQYPAYIIAPQLPSGRRWATYNWREDNPAYGENLTPELSAVLAVLNYESAANPIDTDRVYLTGLSMGGYGSWELAATHPEHFAAVAPVCGAADNNQVQGLLDLPIWTWHGDADRSVPVERSREIVAAIKEAGGTNIRYTELPGVGHDSWTPAYSRTDGLVPWLFQQQRN